MTRYGVDPVRHVLSATWGTGAGDLVADVAQAPAEIGVESLLRLAEALAQLSVAAWRTYTHPASASPSTEVNTEGWRREQERGHFGEIAAAVSAPHLPSGGTLVVSYSPLLESAHRVGRALHAIDDPEFTGCVVGEVTREIAAVESAELGDLTGRAQQAVLLNCEDASPVQVAAADQMLRKDPLGASGLFSEVDPTAAAVAAAHWLAAAAEVAADVSGHEPTEIVMVADDIEALPHESPTLVLEAMDEGASPREAVTDLIRHALQITDGRYPDLEALREHLEEAADSAAKYLGQDDPDLSAITLRLTPLDPERPARDLLEDLLTGIYGCWLMYDTYAGLESDDEELGEQGEEDDEEWDEEQEIRHTEASRQRFAALVREAAARETARLV